MWNLTCLSQRLAWRRKVNCYCEGSLGGGGHEAWTLAQHVLSLITARSTFPSLIWQWVIVLCSPRCCFKNIYFILCMCAWLYVQPYRNAWRSDPLELELQWWARLWVMRTKSGSSARAIRVLHCWAICPGPIRNRFEDNILFCLLKSILKTDFFLFNYIVSE